MRGGGDDRHQNADAECKQLANSILMENDSHCCPRTPRCFLNHRNKFMRFGPTWGSTLVGHSQTPTPRRK